MLAFAIMTILFSIPILCIEYFYVGVVVFPIEKYAVWVEIVFEVLECVFG